MNDSMTRNEDEKEYHCPRCGGYSLVDYGDCFDCVECQLEFEKAAALRDQIIELRNQSLV